MKSKWILMLMFSYQQNLFSIHFISFYQTFSPSDYNYNLLTMQEQQEHLNGNSSSNQNEELMREFSLHEFSDVITQLLESLSIFQKGAVNIQNIYWQIHSKNGVVLGKDIITTIQTIREQIEAQKLIKSQIKLYRQKIQEFEKKGISCLSSIQFSSVFNKEGLITDQLNKQIKNMDFISLQKLKKFISSVEEMSQKNIHIKSNIRVSNLTKSSILRESQIDPDEDIKIENILQFVNSKIVDPGVLANLSTMLKCINLKINRHDQNQQIQKQVENALRANLDQLDNQLYGTYQVIDTKQSEIDRLRTRVKEQEEIFQADNKKFQQLLRNIEILEEQNQQFRQYIGNLTFKNEQLQNKLSWFKENYNGLIKQYEEFIKQKQEKEKKDKSEKQQRLFIQRTIKEQLEDSQAKVTRLRQENGELRKKNQEMAFDYEYKIVFLQKKIQQLEGLYQADKITRKYENSGIRNTYLQTMSRVDSQNMSITGSDYSRKSKDSRVFESHSSVVAFESIISESSSLNKAFKKKKQQIEIEAQSIMTPQDEQDYQIQKSKYKQEPYMKRKTQNNLNFNITMNPNKPKQEDKQKKGLQMKCTLSYFINAEGQKYPTNVIVSADKFKFLDSKRRQNYSIKFNQLRKIIFCYYNTTWMVLKVKSHQKNEKNQTLSDVVLSIQNRPYLLQFLHQKCSPKLFEAGVKITFEKQCDIWITKVDSQSLLSNFQSYNNINRISLGNAGHMFEAKIKFNSMFNFSSDCLLIVTSVGILAFETDGDYLLDKYQKLSLILPLVELMSVQLSTQHRIILKYQTEKKLEYKIQLNSTSHAKKLKNIIEDQRTKNLNKKLAEIQKYQLFTLVLEKGKA